MSLNILSLWNRFTQLLTSAARSKPPKDTPESKLDYELDDGNLVDLDYIPHDRTDPYKDSA